MVDINRSRRIYNYMNSIFSQYNSLKHSTVAGSGNQQKGQLQYWDVVVLTTFDEAQKNSFEQQIEHKRKHGQLPKVAIYVVADPPQQKLGVGGSTLHVLTELHKDLGDLLYQKKVLIIHSGGSSQRLPSYSVLGKIFAPIPATGLALDAGTPQMLDLKLAMYLPFAQLLGPGVFITCADDIETYYLDVSQIDQVCLQSADVVALGHPSSLATGEGHGVYVLQSPHLPQGTTTVHDCHEVLQKPSQSLMRSSGAVYLEEDEESPRERVWSDSVFWLSEKVSRKLVHWYNSNCPLSSELDAYAHFLPCLGSKMLTAKPSQFNDFRSEMLPILQEFKLKLLLLQESEFYHMGTMNEYLMHFNVMQSFSQELGLSKNGSNLKKPFVLQNQGHSEAKQYDSGMLIETYFPDTSVRIFIPDKSTRLVVENCQIHTDVGVSGDVILSNCVLQKCSTISYLTNCINIFGNLLYHTVPIIYKQKTLYVTVAFDIDAKMKSASSSLSGIFNYGCSVKDIISILKYRAEEVAAQPSECLSLWTARLFPGARTAAQSFWITHHAINTVKHCQQGVAMQTTIEQHEQCGLFSMKDIISYKDLETLLKDREQLSNKFMESHT